VSAERADPDPLFATRWVHVFEEDTAEGAVYRPEGDDIPLSRRPRERLQLGRDGSARFFVGGPDDRLVEQPASWREEGGALVIRAGAAGNELRVVKRSPRRLVVRIRRAEPAG
jgi:hypothetical protein